jgi:tankyrase
LTRNLDVQLLLEACKSGDLDVVKRILGKDGELVNCSDKEGRLSTPLHFAAGYNRLEVCKYLIEMHADVLACDKALLQPIHNAASYGHVDVASLLIQSGCDVNSQDVYLFTPLHEAVLKRKYEICKLLVRNGANVSLKNRDGHSPLDLALQLNDPDLIDLIRGDCALLDACKKGQLERVKKLLHAFNVNCADVNGRHSSPLHLAAGFKYIFL